MFYKRPLYSYTLSSWSSYENFTIIDDYDEKCRLYNPYKLHRRYAVDIKDSHSCLDDVCDSQSTGFLKSNCWYNICDQRENTYPNLIEKKYKQYFTLFLRDWYRRLFELLLEEEPGLRFNCLNSRGESGFNNITVKTLATIIKNLPIFIWLLLKVIHLSRNFCVTLRQICKLKHLKFTIRIKIVLLTLQGDIIKMKLDYIVENITLTLHTKMNNS